MQQLKLSVTITLDDDIVEACFTQKSWRNKDIEQQVIKELKRCPSESGLIFEIEVTEIKEIK